MLRKLFSKVSALTFDLYAKATELRKPDGTRKTTKELYEGDPLFPLHNDYIETVIANLKPTTQPRYTILWERKVQKWWVTFQPDSLQVMETINAHDLCGHRSFCLFALHSAS